MGWEHCKKKRQQIEYKYCDIVYRRHKTTKRTIEEDDEEKWSDEIRKVGGVNWMITGLDRKKNEKFRERL